MNIWIVSMECAGIAEAGGVKNVTLSLCNELSKLKQKVTLLIPIYKSTSFELITEFKKDFISNIPVNHCGKDEIVSFSRGVCTSGNFEVIFLNHPSFSLKEGVYTYTENEHKNNPEFIKGSGHIDGLFMDSLFAKSVCEYANHKNEQELPDIIHCQDASTAMIPTFAQYNSKLQNTKCVVTIHNAGPAYHHSFSSVGEAAWYTGFSEDVLNNAVNNQKVEPFLLASNSNAYFTTVSEEYAKEITNPSFATETEGLSTIFFNKNQVVKGITNGIDFERYDPRSKEISCLPFEFDPEKSELDGKTKCRQYFLDEVLGKKTYDGVSVFGNLKLQDEIKKQVIFVYHGRVTAQKGISVLLKAIPSIINTYSNVSFVIAGQGEIGIENQILQMTQYYTGKVVFLNGYSKKLARLTNAIGDFIVLPSFFEPCGLEDFISQIYGTLPIANKTGGLNKIIDYKTGFLYTNNCAESLIAKMSEAITLKKFAPEKLIEMIQYASSYIQSKYLWSMVVKNEYLPFFEQIIKKK